jgi:hypothetical protein
MINITHLRIKPLTLASDHGRYNIAVTPERALFSVGEWPLHISELNSSYTPQSRSALGVQQIIPGKNVDTRIKPLPLTNGHGRYITVTPERTLASVG